MVKPAGAQPASRLTKRPEGQQEAHGDCRYGRPRATRVRTPHNRLWKARFRISRPTPEDAPAPPRPENKRVWASLLKGKDAVIQEVAEEMGRRDPSASKTRVALTDGERALQIRVDRKLKVTLILDLIHALEKTVESRLCLPCRGQSGCRSLGHAPHPARLPGRQCGPG